MFNRIELWFWTYAWAWLLVIYPAIFGQKRMSHNNGIVTTGRVRVVDEPGFPPHRISSARAGAPRSSSRRLRHASASDDDDTVIQVRSASLKFQDSRLREPPRPRDEHGPDLDLLDGAHLRGVRHGKQAIRRSTASTTATTTTGTRTTACHAAQGGVRDNPSSPFAEVYYYTETVQLFVAARTA